MNKEQILYMDRFNGLEEYEINYAIWNFYTEDNCGNLHLQLRSEYKRDEDDLYPRTLTWEINFVKSSSNFSELQLVKGFETNVLITDSKNADSYYNTNFYYYEHQSSEDNYIQILDVQSDKILAKITGDVTDLNFYDGSKPRSKLTATVWFTRDPNGSANMGGLTPDSPYYPHKPVN